MTAASAAGAGEAAAKEVSRRFEALLSVRSKAMKGKGAWYWAHLEPLLLQGQEPGLAMAVKLRCSLCDAVFSASNPSRTASEHLKRGACPSFNSAAAAAVAAAVAAAGPTSAPKPISSLPPFRKRPALPSASTDGEPSSPSCLALVAPYATATCPPYSSSPFPPPPPLPLALPAPHNRLVLSGGKEDLGALAMLEDSVKRLKNPKATPCPALPKPQADAAISFFADWLLESGGGASPSSLDHPKLRAFLHQVGLPSLSPRTLVGPLLDSRFHHACAESVSRVGDALFFQLDSAGWNCDHGLISLAVNLPNGSSVFHRAILTASRATSDYAVDVLRDAIATVSSDGATHRCVGIVADRFKSKALRILETEKQWMINIPCQLHGFHKLIQDFASNLPIFQSAISVSSRIASFFNSNSLARSLLQKHQLHELEHSHLLHSPPQPFDLIVEDVLGSSQSLQLTVQEEDYRLLCLDNSTARELAEVIRDIRFWNELEAVDSLVKLVERMSKDMETDRPLIGQCLPLWEELKSKVKCWRAKFVVDDGVEDVVEQRFKKSYHPAWSAAFILDPLYLTKNPSGKYLPPFDLLSPEQERDVERLVTRLAPREESQLVLAELRKWRTEGLDPLYAQAVQVKQPDPATGKMRVANPSSARLVWKTCLGELGSLGRVAVRLIFLHATACRLHYSPRLLGPARLSRAAVQRLEKMAFVAAQSRFERRTFSDEEEKDADIMGEEFEQSTSMEPSSL